MSIPKKLNLNYEELCNIAKAINENTLLNRIKNKEDRISTDHFLRQKFNISRKDFSFTIKEAGIKYNQTTFMYDIENYKSNTNVILEMAATSEEVTKENEAIKYKSSTYIFDSNLEEVLPMLSEMIEWYKIQKNDSLKIPKEQIELSLNDSRLCGDICSHPIKCYENIFLKFKEVCKQYSGYKQQDLISKALLEFIDKYKK